MKQLLSCATGGMPAAQKPVVTALRTSTLLLWGLCLGHGTLSSPSKFNSAALCTERTEQVTHLDSSNSCSTTSENNTCSPASRECHRWFVYMLPTF